MEKHYHKGLIPGTAKDIVEDILASKWYTMKDIERGANISSRTIARVLNGLPISARTELSLIQLYCILQPTSYS